MQRAEQKMAFREAHNGSWIAVQVQPTRETAVDRSLRSRGYDTFLPLGESGDETPVRRARPEKALFPGYVFCKFVSQPSSRIVEAPGVIRLVGFNNRIAAVPDEDIEAIRRVVSSSCERKPIELPELGREVRVVSGSLAGLAGHYMRHKRRDWLVLSVPLLSRFVAVEIDLSSVCFTPRAAPE
jgi:transcription antitermination factor NusG